MAYCVLSNGRTNDICFMEVSLPIVSETSSEPGLKAMTYNVLLNGKWYKVTYLVSQPEDFPIYLQTAQSMIDSFQIISRQ